MGTLEFLEEFLVILMGSQAGSSNGKGLSVPGLGLAERTGLFPSSISSMLENLDPIYVRIALYDAWGPFH